MADVDTEIGAVIATQVIICSDTFDRACWTLSNADVRLRNKIQPWALRDEMGRFHLWCFSTAAHLYDETSLDYKLRESSHIRDEVLDLLQSIKTALHEVLEILEGTRQPWEDIPDSNTETSSQADSDNEEEETELQQLSCNLSETITCLTRLIDGTRNIPIRDQFDRQAHDSLLTYKVDPSIRKFLRTQFPKADEYLVQRLGTALTRKRAILKRRHQQHIGSTISTHTEQSLEFDEDLLLHILEDVPKVQPPKSRALQVTELASSLSTLSLSLPTPTKFKPSPRLEAPFPLEVGNSETFDCNVCFRSVTIQQPREWSTHLYQDLRPYVCSRENCSIPDYTFDTLEDWFRHEMHFHEQRWECKAGCNFWTKIEANFRDHLRQRHSEILNEDDLVRFCQRDAHLNSENVSCPLCKTEEMLLEDLKDHLGYHYELVALCMFAPLIYKEPENHPALLSNQSEQSTADSMEYVPHLTSPGKLKTQSLDALSKPSMSKQRIAFSKFPTPESSSQTSRAVRFPERQFSSYSRPLNLEEKRAARDYETHAVQCTHCRGIYKIQPDYQQTCDVGHSLAQELTRHMFNDVDSNTNNVIEEKLGQLESYRGFDEVSGLLRAIERSLPERSRTSIVDMDRDIVHPKATSGMGFKQSKGEIAGSQAGSDMARRNVPPYNSPNTPPKSTYRSTISRHKGFQLRWEKLEEEIREIIEAPPSSAKKSSAEPEERSHG